MPTGSVSRLIDSFSEPANPSVDGNFDENGWESFSSLFDSMTSTDLVQLFYDILEEHVFISKSKIAQLHEIPTLRQLIAISPGAIAREGFRTLELMLAGEKSPTFDNRLRVEYPEQSSIIEIAGDYQGLSGSSEPSRVIKVPQIYAFVHVAYTASLVANRGNGANDNLKQMFISICQLGTFLESDQEKNRFANIATAVWSVPIEADSTINQPTTYQPLYGDPAMPANCSLVKTCTLFLDRGCRSIAFASLVLTLSSR